MEAIKYVLLGTGLSFLGTVLGSSIVFFYKSLNKKIERCCLGFAAGVMMAASIFSLIIPSMNISTKAGDNALIPVVTGLVLGGLFLLFLDRIIPHLHIGNNKPEGIKTKLENLDTKKDYHQRLKNIELEIEKLSDVYKNLKVYTNLLIEKIIVTKLETRYKMNLEIYFKDGSIKNIYFEN